jgi:DNA-binding transcriptional LysR family regulator
MPVHHATLHQLTIFDAVARHLSFARAAEELHLTPPALSIQVRHLSETLQQTLYEQIGKQIYLTAAGELVAKGCRDILTRLEGLSQELDALQGLERGRLRIAVLTTAKYFIPRLLGRFCAEHPGVEASLSVGNRKVLLKRLAQNLDDLYILGQPPEHIPAIAEPFADNPLVMVARPEHPLARVGRIEPARLARESFILREFGSGTRLATEHYFEQQGVALHTRMELGSNEAIKQTVLGGLGLAVLSESTIRGELASGELVALAVRGFPLQHKWHLVYPQGKAPTPAAKAFSDYLFSSLPQH